MNIYEDSKPLQNQKDIEASIVKETLDKEHKDKIIQEYEDKLGY